MAWKYETAVSENKWLVDYFAHIYFPDPVTMTLDGAHSVGQAYIVVKENLFQTYTGGIYLVPAPLPASSLKIKIGDDTYEYYAVDRNLRRLHLTTSLSTSYANDTPVVLLNRALRPNVKALVYNDSYNLKNVKIQARIFPLGLTGALYSPALIIRYRISGGLPSFYALHYYVGGSSTTQARVFLYKVVSGTITVIYSSPYITGLHSMNARLLSLEALESSFVCKYESHPGIMASFPAVSDTSILTPGYCGIEWGYRSVTYEVTSAVDSIQISELS